MLRLLTKAVNPFTRTAMLTFAWTHRHSIMRWGRSLYNELKRPGMIEPRRVQQISRVLWTITRDDTLSGAKQLRQVSLNGDVLVIDAKPGWKRQARLVDALEGIPGIADITDPAGKSLTGSISTASR